MYQEIGREAAPRQRTEVAARVLRLAAHCCVTVAMTARRPSLPRLLSLMIGSAFIQVVDMNDELPRWMRYTL